MHKNNFNTFSVNNSVHFVPYPITVLEACDFLGYILPHFCYHKKLSIAGNCRLCLVESLNSLKLLASCAINLDPSLHIFLDTELVKKSREGVLEFLLINHPLDCPICDQGGECDLQDQSIVFGGDRGRFYGLKRSVEDKYCGPFIKTSMNRCIHCTRCVRFSLEFGGTSNLGITGRGSKMEIGFYLNSFINSELSGNVIDLCPVGALTSKPSSFLSRSWEVKQVLFFDFFDPVGSEIWVHIRGLEIMRVLPKLNPQINGSWIPDKIRFFVDGLLSQRVSKPFSRLPTFPRSSVKKISLCPILKKLHLQVFKRLKNFSNLSWDEYKTYFLFTSPQMQNQNYFYFKRFSRKFHKHLFSSFFDLPLTTLLDIFLNKTVLFKSYLNDWRQSKDGGKRFLSVTSSLVPLSWSRVLFVLRSFFISIIKKLSKLKYKFFFIYPFFGEFNDIISLVFFKNFFSYLGNPLYTSNSFDSCLYYKNLNLYNYQFYQDFSNLYKSDFICVIGLNSRLESPILHLHLRKSFLKNHSIIFSFSFFFDSNFFIKFLGSHFFNILSFIEGRHWLCHKVFLSKSPLFIFGDTFFQNFKPIFSNFFLSFLSSFFSFYERGSKDFFFFLHNSISKQHSIDLGLSSGIHNQKSLFFNYNRFKSFKLFRLSKLASNHFYSTNSKVLPSIFFFYGSNDIFSNLDLGKYSLSILQSSHSTTRLISQIDILLPQSHFVEKHSISLTGLGILKKTSPLINCPSFSKTDWKILQVIYNLLGTNLSPNRNFLSFLSSSKSYYLSRNFPYIYYSKQFFFFEITFFSLFFFSNRVLTSFCSDYYLSDSLSRSSGLMSFSSSFFYNQLNNFLIATFLSFSLNSLNFRKN